MKRYAAGIALALLACALIGAPTSTAAMDTGDSSFPVNEFDRLEMHVTANCVPADRQCYFTTQAQLRTPDGIAGFPNDLWARQTTTIRSNNRQNWLETQVVADNTRQYKILGKREITTIFFGGGPPEKYFITGQTQPTEYATGLPKLDATYIDCAEIQVVYSGVTITSPST